MSKELELLHRVFKVIKEEYFNDHKLSPHYHDLLFPKQLGEDIAGYIQSREPNYFHRQRKRNELDKQVEKILNINL